MSAIQTLVDYASEFEGITKELGKQAAKELKELQAAQELAELRRHQIEEMNRSYEITMREGCADDEMHCTCVPALRHRIKELEEMLKASEK